MNRLPIELVQLLDRLRGLLGGGGGEQQVGAGRFQLQDLRVDGRVGDLVGRLGDDHRPGLVAEPGLDAVEIVLAEIVVLIEHADLGGGMLLQNVLPVDAALGEVVGIVSHGPGEVLRIGEFGCAGRGEQLRHFFGVQVFLNRGVGRRADDLERQQHLVVFDQLADLLDGLRRRIGVVILDELDLAAVDAALLIDHVEIGGLRLADRGIGRSGTRERHGLADLDLGVRGAGIILLLGRG